MIIRVVTSWFTGVHIVQFVIKECADRLTMCELMVILEGQGRSAARNLKISKEDICFWE